MANEKQQINKTARLTETAIMIAAAMVLSFIKLIDMPFGGSVTLFSMLPIAIVAFRYGVPWGLLAGLVNAVIQMLFGMKNLTYATSAGAAVAIVMLDYIVAFTVLGLAGMFRNKIKDNGTALTLGCFVACLLRFLSHTIAGCTVWAGVSIPDADGLIYSLAYNAAYMIPETVVTMVGGYFVANILTLTSPEVKRRKMEPKATSALFTSIPVVVGIALIFVMIFSMVQTEDGFDITAIASADIWDWIRIAVIALVAGITAAIIRVLMMAREQEKKIAS